MDGSGELWRYEMENNKELTDIPEGENVGSVNMMRHTLII